MEFNQEALIRSIGISDSTKHMILLGAGASLSSGIPTAEQCIWEWKRDIFLSSNPSVSTALFQDITLPITKNRIQNWLDSQNKFPSRGDPTEYGRYAELAYPKPEDRRRYFSRRFEKSHPQIGYKLLAKAIESGFFKNIWTTNFDNLLMRSRAPNHSRVIKEIGIDSTARINSSDVDDTHQIVYLHGDYRYDLLQNTSNETKALNTELQKDLIKKVRTNSLVVLGYNGRDESVMASLEEAIKQKSEGGAIYWCTLRGHEINPRVVKLISDSKSKGYDSHIIEIEGFDEFFINLAKYLYREGKDLAELDELLKVIVPSIKEFVFEGYEQTNQIISSNALRLELPKNIYQIEKSTLSNWKDLKSTIGKNNICASFLGKKIILFGEISEIASAFNGKIDGGIELVPLNKEGHDYAPNIKSVLVSAVQKSLANKFGLVAQGKDLIWDKNEFQNYSYNGNTYRAFPAVRIAIENIENDTFLTISLDLKVVDHTNHDPGKEIIKEIKRQGLTKQYNKQYSETLTKWKDKFLAKNTSLILKYPDSTNGFIFKIYNDAVFARIYATSSGSRTQPLSERFKAISIKEPVLVFGSAKGHPSPKDIHPIRGLVDNGPYDLQLTTSGMYNEIRLGVICPKKNSSIFNKNLKDLLKAHSDIETKQEYLVPFPGFQQAYRIPLNIPELNTEYWRELPDLVLGTDTIKGQKEITSAITREIESLVSHKPADILIIYIPREWSSYEKVDTPEVSSDLHDFIKAYCAQKGIRTQLIKEQTFEKRQKCEVLWWISQAIYAKSLRLPFLLEKNDSDTVFVGIGYGFNKQKREGGIVMGCSHVYDAAGKGLKYQLSKIDHPIWKQDNPYLSRDDAIKVGIQVRQLFSEAYQELPKRVVIHKRTPFTKDEREGLLVALKDVKDLELVTIEEEDNWKFLAHNSRYNSPDFYPISRGTLLLLNKRSFLLWIHGNMNNLAKDGKSYFQGKSRIPTPIKVTRFLGKSSPEQVANELLSLSKIDWNNFELYDKMPITLKTASTIARIGKLITNFRQDTYDYRLFM